MEYLVPATLYTTTHPAPPSALIHDSAEVHGTREMVRAGLKLPKINVVLPERLVCFQHAQVRVVLDVEVKVKAGGAACLGLQYFGHLELGLVGHVFVRRDQRGVPFDLRHKMGGIGIVVTGE